MGFVSLIRESSLHPSTVRTPSEEAVSEPSTDHGSAHASTLGSILQNCEKSVLVKEAPSLWGFYSS